MSLGNSGSEMEENQEKITKLYPNCDINVWMRSCEKEIIEPISGEVWGVIPNWINGSLLRNGPGNLKFGESTFNHLFDGSALLHRFNIKNGTVTYQCRFLETETYKKNKEANRIVVTEFGTSAVPDPCHSIFDKVSSIFNPGETLSDNALVSIYPICDEYFAFYESPVIHKIDPITLETKERRNLYSNFGIVNHTAHPHVMKDGTVYNLGLTVKKTGPFYNIICFPNEERKFKEAKIVASIPARRKLSPAYMHSFGITENYFIIIEQPLVVRVPSMIKNNFESQPIIKSLKWLSKKSTYFHVINRENGELFGTFCAMTFFFFHIINQYEEEDHLIIDLICYDDPSLLNLMYIDSLQNMQTNEEFANIFKGQAKRFVLPLYAYRDLSPSYSFMGKFFKSLSIEEEDPVPENLVTLPNTNAIAYRLPNRMILCDPEKLIENGCEVPRISYDTYLGKDYKFFYATSNEVDGDLGMVLKVNVKEKTKIFWTEPNCYPSEPIFVPKPNAVEEDDGVVICSILWGEGAENRVGLLVLCAKTMNELGRCEFVTPSPVPKCLHGWFASNI